MPFSSEISLAAYDCSTVLTSFSIPFDYLDDEDNIQVTLVTVATGTCSILTLTTDYTVDTDDDEVDLVTAYGGSYQLIIGPKMPLTQVRDWADGYRYGSATMEDALDKLTILINQLQLELDRCLKYPVSGYALDAELPNITSRGNAYITFDSTTGEMALQAAVTPSTATVTAWGHSLISATDRLVGASKMLGTIYGTSASYALLDADNYWMVLLEAAAIVSLPTASDNAYRMLFAFVGSTAGYYLSVATSAGAAIHGEISGDIKGTHATNRRLWCPGQAMGYISDETTWQMIFEQMHHTDIIPIWDWDMLSIESVTVSLTSNLDQTRTMFCAVSAMVRNDDGELWSQLSRAGHLILDMSLGTIGLFRTTAGTFENAAYDTSVAYLRGMVKVDWLQ